MPAQVAALHSWGVSAPAVVRVQAPRARYLKTAAAAARGAAGCLCLQNAGPSCYLTKLGAAQPISAESTVIAASASIAPMNTCRRDMRGGCGTLISRGLPQMGGGTTA